MPFCTPWRSELGRFRDLVTSKSTASIEILEARGVFLLNIYYWHWWVKLDLSWFSFDLLESWRPASRWDSIYIVIANRFGSLADRVAVEGRSESRMSRMIAWTGQFENNTESTDWLVTALSPLTRSSLLYNVYIYHFMIILLTSFYFIGTSILITTSLLYF